MNPGNPSLSSYRFALNPLTYYCASYLVLIVMLPLAYLNTMPEIVDKAAYLQTFLISVLFLAFIVAGFGLSYRVGHRVAHGFLAGITLRFSGNQLTLRERKIVCGVLTCLFLSTFAVHMVVSGGGLLWITNSRQAYASFRIGGGLTYGLCQVFLYLATIFGLFTISLSQPSARIIWQIIQRVCLFSFFAYFMGSKGGLLGVTIIALTFYNYNVRPIRLKTLLLFGIGILGISLALLFLQGTSANAQDATSYADYYHNSSEFLRRFDEWGGYRYGGVMVSDLWSYVPRALFPNKPYEYGVVLLDQLLYPGAAETGYTPAFLPWTPIYLDFGLFGVAGIGLYNGMCMGWIHTFYSQRPPSLMRFVVLMQLGFVAIFPIVPTLGILMVVLPLLSMAVIGCQTVFRWLKYAALYQVMPPTKNTPQ